MAENYINAYNSIGDRIIFQKANLEIEVFQLLMLSFIRNMNIWTKTALKPTIFNEEQS